MQSKVDKATTMVFRKDNGWAFEHYAGKYTIAFHDEYRSAGAAAEAARELFPEDPIEVEGSIPACSGGKSTLEEREKMRRFG